MADFRTTIPDPSKRENLRALSDCVRAHNADLGCAFDGDGDRLGLVDENGRAIPPDSLIMLFAGDVLQSTPEGTIVYDVKCSHRIERYVRSLGGNPLMSRTGHSYIKKLLSQSGAHFAGEASGHTFFPDQWFLFDDALYACARALRIIGTRKASEVFTDLSPGLVTSEIQVPVSDEAKFELVAEATQLAENVQGELKTVDGLRIDRRDSWGVLRASNTSPNLVLRFGGDSHAAVSALVEDFQSHIGAHLRLSLDFKALVAQNVGDDSEFF